MPHGILDDIVCMAGSSLPDRPGEGGEHEVRSERGERETRSEDEEETASSKESKAKHRRQKKLERCSERRAIESEKGRTIERAREEKERESESERRESAAPEMRTLMELATTVRNASLSSLRSMLGTRETGKTLPAEPKKKQQRTPSRSLCSFWRRSLSLSLSLCVCVCVCVCVRVCPCRCACVTLARKEKNSK